MPLANYTELQEAVVRFAMRTGDDEFENSVPDFIALLESILNHGATDQAPLRTADMEESATLSLVDGAATLPADYLETRSVTAGHYGDLTLITPSEAATRFASGGYGPFYTIKGRELRSYAQSDTVGLDYYEKIPALSNANPTNWLLTKAPNVYLYGSLLQSAPFMMDDGRMATWSQLFTQSMGGVIGSDMTARWARAATRVRGATP